MKGHAAAKSGNDAKVVVVPAVWTARPQVDRSPYLNTRLQRIFEIVGKDSNHACRDAVEGQNPADSVGSPAEILAPDTFPNDRNASIGALVHAIEHAPHERLDSEHAEIVRAHVEGLHALRARPIGQVHGVRSIRVNGGHVERLALVAIREQRQPGKVIVFGARHVIEPHESIGFGVWQRTQHHRVEDAEDRCVGA